MLLLKGLARLVEALLMIALALIALGVALVGLDQLISIGGAYPPRLLHLPVVRHHVGHFIAQLDAPGPVATLALVGGIAAIVIGLLLLVGLLGSRRERLLVVDADEQTGTLSARPRALGRMARAEAEGSPGVTGVRRPKIRLKRNGESGRLKVRATRGPDPDLATVDDAVHARIDPFAESLHLTPKVRIKLREPKEDDA